jgi:hypothetical protein
MSNILLDEAVEEDVEDSTITAPSDKYLRYFGYLALALLAIAFVVETIFHNNETVMAFFHWIYKFSIVASSALIVTSAYFIFSIFQKIRRNLTSISHFHSGLGSNIEKSVTTYLSGKGNKLLEQTLFKSALNSLKIKGDNQAAQMRLMINFIEKLDGRQTHLAPAITYLLEPAFEKIEKSISDISSLTDLYHMNAGEQVKMSKIYVETCRNTLEFIDYELGKALAEAWSEPFMDYVKSVGTSDTPLVRSQIIICDGKKKDFFLENREFLREQVKFMIDNGFDVFLVFKGNLGKLSAPVFNWRSEIFDKTSLFRVQNLSEFNEDSDINVAISAFVGDPDFSAFYQEINAHKGRKLTLA